MCEWPGHVRLDLNGRGGRFEQQAWVDRTLYLDLPGGAGRWPIEVRVDGQVAPVLVQDGVPAVELNPGAHRIEGRFEWQKLPERLQVPAQVALIALSVEGKAIALPRRDDQHQLWIGRGPSELGDGERLSLDVTRKLEDGVPLTVTTRITLHVAGRAREVSLGSVLLDGTAPLSIASELPARLEPDGSLRMQLRAGSYLVTIVARATASPEQLRFKTGSALWPENEVWVWQANEALRQVELSGPPAVDPARTELAADWRGLPAFLLADGAVLALKTLRRGEPAPPPNRIGLTRELWLDLDGGGYTARDRLDVELHRDFRLDLLAGELGHAAVDGEDMLITRPVEGHGSGVELRKARQQVVAEWRAAGALGTQPAVGWSQDVQSLSTRLYMGPGFTVLGMRGADGISQSWVQDWDLFDLFVVLLVAIVVARLFGRGSGLLALVALVLCHGEAGAPGVVFFFILATGALLRVLATGWFRRFVLVGYWASVIGLLIVSVPFLIGQMRSALYPQLGTFAGDDGWLRTGFDMQAEESAVVAMPQAPADMMQEVAPVPSGGGDGEQAEPKARPPVPKRRAVRSSPLRKEEAAQDKDDAYSQLSRAQSKAALGAQQDPAATVQTGPGVPTWSWRSWQLSWSGPVDRAQALTLYVLSPLANRLLGCARVLLLGLLIALLLRRGIGGSGRTATSPLAPSRSAPPPASSAGLERAALGLALISAWLVPATTRAQFPGPELLQELRTRLLETPRCVPACANIESLLIDVGPGGLRLLATVHAGALTSVRLPGPASSWTPAELSLDGHALAPALLHEDGYVHVRLAPGSHALEARGPMPASDTLTLEFADRPQRTKLHAVGFDVDGVREDGAVEQAVQLSRAVVAPSGEAVREDTLAPWLSFERELVLGVRWQLQSTLTRLTATGTPLRVRVPLLAGESVTESGLQVEDNAVQLSLGRDDTTASWSSTLSEREAIELLASTDRPWSERWRVTCGPIWHCDFSGVTPNLYMREGRLEPEFWPLPGERVTVRVRKPEAAKGVAFTIDEARLNVTPGTRMLDAMLELHVRGSRRASESLALPAGAQVQKLEVDGQPRPIRLEGGALKYALEPGAHEVKVSFQQQGAQGLWTSTPAIALGRAASNAHITLRMPADRWLLWARGPAFGPAILFWGYLLLVLAAGFLLGRAPGSPLRSTEAMLLGVGLTQIPAPAALLIVGWFFAIAYRGRSTEQSWWRHDLMQLGLLLWTLSAIGALYAAVHAGLLMQPDMQVAGAGSSGFELHYIIDRIADRWPIAGVLSVPLWVFRVLMLLWALWLAIRLVRWSTWAFACYAHGGLWKRRPARQNPPPPALTQP